MNIEEMYQVKSVWIEAYDVLSQVDGFTMDKFLWWIVDDMGTCEDGADGANRTREEWGEEFEPESWVDFLDIYQLIRYPLMEELMVDVETFVRITTELDIDYDLVLDDIEGWYGLTKEDYDELLSRV